MSGKFGTPLTYRAGASIVSWGHQQTQQTDINSIVFLLIITELKDNIKAQSYLKIEQYSWNKVAGTLQQRQPITVTPL